MRTFLSCLLFLFGVPLLAQPLEVMTYNIRLNYSGDGENKWDNRKEKMINQLKFYEPDIFGIQEGLPEQVRFLDENLKDYKYFGVGRDDGKDGGEHSAIYYQDSKFEVLKSGTFWLSPTPEKPSKGWDADYPRVCTYGLFKRKSDSVNFWVFNTHFDHVGKNARIHSMNLILSRIKSYNPENLPVILMGDLNVTPKETPIQKMTEVLRDSRIVARNVFGPDATFNGFHFDQTPERRIDYIAVSNHFSVLKYAVLTDSYDQKYISDHFPVFCSLSFED